MRLDQTNIITTRSEIVRGAHLKPIAKIRRFMTSLSQINFRTTPYRRRCPRRLPPRPPTAALAMWWAT